MWGRVFKFGCRQVLLHCCHTKVCHPSLFEPIPACWAHSPYSICVSTLGCNVILFHFNVGDMSGICVCLSWVGSGRSGGWFGTSLLAHQALIHAWMYAANLVCLPIIWGWWSSWLAHKDQHPPCRWYNMHMGVLQLDKDGAVSPMSSLIFIPARSNCWIVSMGFRFLMYHAASFGSGVGV